MQRTDILVLGSGIAGLSCALYASAFNPRAKITLVTKCRLTDSNTFFAQGGMAAATSECEELVQSHISDTLRAGDGLCDPSIVEMVVRESFSCFRQLEKWGVSFDRLGEKMHLALEGGHSEPRVLHCADHTGRNIAQALIARLKESPQVTIMEDCFATDLLVSDNTCYGVTYVREETPAYLQLHAGHVVIASGGTGQVYRSTTNPAVATGDGIAMAARAGAIIRDMEFIQFHPTALALEDSDPRFLITEALRGFGAKLLNANGERFMERYHQHAELACRDVVSRAIVNEMRTCGSRAVFLDCRHLEKRELLLKFPTVLGRLGESGIDASRMLIPVAPAAHYCCGGIATDKDGRTSIRRLFAVGESASTGLHGANRLASNSLTEALVFAGRAAKSISGDNSATFAQQSEVPSQKNAPGPDVLKAIHDIKKKTRNLMDTLAVTVSNAQLARVMRHLEALSSDFSELTEHTIMPRSAVETGNILRVSMLIAQASLDRAHNAGTFFKADMLTLA